MKKILILAGPSAVGKTTLAKAILSSFPEFEYSKSATTRAPRGDGHDSEYLYLTVPEFKEAVKSDRMLEYTEYAGNFYGTPKSEIDRIYREGKTPLLVLDLDGVANIKREGEYGSFAVYLYDDLNVLEGRLYERYCGTPHGSADGSVKFAERKARNIREFSDIDSVAEGFDTLIKNSVIEETVSRILAEYKSERAPKKDTAIAQIKAMLD